MTTVAQEDPHGDAHGHGAHGEHPKFLAHHFDTPQQQFDSGKLGTWLFLTTEVLLFSGLFCAYAVYRALHPEIFEFAHQYLNKWLGALNTIVLIFSSFTMAWGVRAAQLGQKKLCCGLLFITILCGAGFMVVKAVEYSTKFKEELYVGQYYNPKEMPASEIKEEKTLAKVDASETAVIPAPGPSMTQAAPALTHNASGLAIEQSAIPRASIGPAGLNPDWTREENARLTNTKISIPRHPMDEPNNVQIFFSIYFMMTGLHGIHVLAGMALIGWCLFRANRGDFGPEYFSPVDFVGLYWHIVDLVWIFLFPLLYLIS